MSRNCSTISHNGPREYTSCATDARARIGSGTRFGRLVEREVRDHIPELALVRRIVGVLLRERVGHRAEPRSRLGSEVEEAGRELAHLHELEVERRDAREVRAQFVVQCGIVDPLPGPERRDQRDVRVRGERLRIRHRDHEPGDLGSVGRGSFVPGAG